MDNTLQRTEAIFQTDAKLFTVVLQGIQLRLGDGVGNRRESGQVGVL